MGLGTCLAPSGSAADPAAPAAPTPAPAHAGPTLYTEDVLAAMPERIRQWKQLVAYADLPNAAGKAGPSGRTLAEKIGYPPRDLLGQPSVRQERSGEDAVATYYRIWVQITPELEAYGLYLVPKNRTGRAPLVIAAHGGGGFPELAAFYSRSNYHDMVRGAVERGYIVFAPHLVFYPYHDRDHGSPIPEDVRASLDQKLRARGTSLMAVEIAKITQTLDVLLQRPEIDPARVAMIGLSWGGAYTQYTAALDPRIRVAVSACSWQGELPAPPAQPGYGKHEDITTLALVGLILPRPLQLQFGERDPLLPIGKVRAEAPRLDPRVDLQISPGAHEFNGERAWPFLQAHL